MTANDYCHIGKTDKVHTFYKNGRIEMAFRLEYIS
jgi:hypothetical protein